MKIRLLVATALLAAAPLTLSAQATRPAAASSTASKPAAAEASSHDDVMQAAMKPGKVTFRANNEVFNAVGTFNRWMITDMYLPEDGDWSKGRVELTFDTSTVEANADKLTEHLKQDDMLKVQQFPAATVTVHSAKAKEDNPHAFDAQATVKLLGVEKTVPVSFERNPENHHHIKGTATIDRDAFGVYEPHDPANKYSPEKTVSIEMEMMLPDPHAFMAAKKAVDQGKGSATSAASAPASRPAN